MTLPVSAISVRQPWAWAIIHGGKDVENRSKAPFGTKGLLGRRVAIHAAQGMAQLEYERARAFMLDLGVECPRPDRLVRGAIIGSVRLDNVVSERPSRWFFGPRGLVLYDAKACEPVPASGQLGWFKWKPEDRDPVAPLPWMRKWPNTIVHREFCDASPGPLFEQAPQ
ncbi:hypothetical protein [Hyphomonas sp. UBA4494]|jgi:hypothetical protein|uniref:hypothetical protein n=1 Tax=Hyphomonas sp. UBA4494 TaxID=1946631 RepID=UPI0025BADEAA|nr:hypothetical protein [Hyphomonas sp. UBA4494]